jgi:hypothetical protein
VIKRTREIEKKFKIADRYMKEEVEPMLYNEESSQKSDLKFSDHE